MGDTIVAWAIHHQDDVTYGISSGFQCSCMSLVSVSWTLLRSRGLWDAFDLDYILNKEVQLLNLSANIDILG